MNKIAVRVLAFSPFAGQCNFDVTKILIDIVLDRSSETLIALRRIVHALEANAREMARASGLTQAQLLVLHTLARNGQEMPRDIARSLGVGQATISIQIDKLEMRGLVRRERRQADRRAVWVILTETGRNLLDQTPDPLYERFSARFRDLSSWEQAMLMAVTERVAGMLDAEDTTPLLHPAETTEASALYPSETG